MDLRMFTEGRVSVSVESTGHEKERRKLVQ